ncbi:MAG: glycosyltransferase family 2 protein [Bacteroidales bacterium]|nr:glycosyltransferase family 2 protein [Bacteroidales bacterium]
MSRLTVLMPTYNVAPWVEEAIDSVLRQTYRDFELLVVDDGSTDATLDHVRSIQDNRIRIAAFPDNVGLAENLNRGLDLINTELVARMDGDDIAEPDWLETGVHVLDTMPDVGICSFGFQFFGTKTSLVRFPEHNEDSKAQMLFGCTVIVPVFRKSVFTDNHLRYLTETFPAEDYSLWARAYRVAKVYNVQRTLFHYRTHPTQISTARREAQIVKSNDVRLQMLEWLSPNFSKDEKRYFLDNFVSCRINSKDDIKNLKGFAELLVIRNTQRHYSSDALRRKFDSHIAYGVLKFAERTYFAQRYTPIAIVRLISDGLYSLLPKKNRRKLIAKCLLLKRK